ncbi:hypothetical protein CC80DRAFT_501541 [Byssothecium circinans]|uniref:Uncharacterized protein n=1 Tax=Byssothecium circinans TaxID=147558 RepID=A0A6A5U558_9PLEO|nr:hypothetical protein CC80DRAFT_501541 [Byssothecium circinans]
MSCRYVSYIGFMSDASSRTLKQITDEYAALFKASSIAMSNFMTAQDALYDRSKTKTAAQVHFNLANALLHLDTAEEKFNQVGDLLDVCTMEALFPIARSCIKYRSYNDEELKEQVAEEIEFYTSAYEFVRKGSHVEAFRKVACEWARGLLTEFSLLEEIDKLYKLKRILGGVKTNEVGGELAPEGAEDLEKECLAEDDEDESAEVESECLEEYENASLAVNEKKGSVDGEKPSERENGKRKRVDDSGTQDAAVKRRRTAVSE